LQILVANCRRVFSEWISLQDFLLPFFPAFWAPERPLCSFNILNNREGRRVAVIVNDMSEVNIDAALVRDGGAELSRTEEKLVELSNGCICRTLRADILKEVPRLASEKLIKRLAGAYPLERERAVSGLQLAVGG
jgi:hypothetical protein